MARRGKKTGRRKTRGPKRHQTAKVGGLGLLQKMNKKLTRIELAVNPSRALKAKARKARRAALAAADYSAYDRTD